MQKNNITENLRELRNFKKITIALLHKYTGISRNTLTKYETDRKIPPISNLIKIASFFKVSLDFLLLWDKSQYPRSIEILKLAEKIDKMDELKRFQIETTCKTLMGKADLDNQFVIKIDDAAIKLTPSFNNNLKIIREKRGKSQAQLANETSLLQSRISYYEKKQIPPAERLINLSECLNISIHALATGEKLFYSFRNKDLLDVILKADKFLSLENKNIIIILMTKILEEA